MGFIELGVTKFDIEKYNWRNDYLLWERQVEGIRFGQGVEAKA